MESYDVVRDVDTFAIDVRNVWKSYGFGKSSFSVLRGLNLTVPRATIYGLLGPSGCGKTTMLKCLLGESKIDYGSITVMGLPPGGFLREQNEDAQGLTVGYMPQDIALNVQLSLRETFRLFGALYGLSSKKIQERAEFLLDFLGIADQDKFIGNLSGGQQRRASFAIALLHEPQLLILDEPTVGVDPILRRNIWNYLNKMVNAIYRPTTIIITTHYIEEARMANNVGMMLNGKMLTEGCPSDMIQKYCCATLEQVFLKLCLNVKNEDQESDDGQQIKNMIETCEKPKTVRSQKSSCLVLPSWRRIKALTLKNVLFFFRLYGILIFEIFLPPIIILVFSFTVGTPLFGMPVGVVNEDSFELGNMFLNQIDKVNVIQHPYDSYEDAQLATLHGTIKGIVHLNSNFSEAMKSRLNEGVLADDITVLNSQVSVYLDWTTQPVAIAINGELFFAFRRFSQQLLSSMYMKPQFGDVPIKYEDTQIHGSRNVYFNQFLFPGIMICVAFFMSMSLTAISLVLERKSGALERLTVSGVRSIEFIFAHLNAQSFVMTIQILLEVAISFAVLGFACKGSYVLIVLMLILQGICGMLMGILLAVSFVSETVVIMMCTALWFMFLFLQGYLWPVEGMAVVLRFIIRMLPQTLAIEALRSIINRGWDITHPQVYMAFTVTLSWSIIFLLVALGVTRRKL